MADLETQAANALRMARAFAGMDQTEFAQALAKATGRKLTRAMVSNWERGANEYYATVLIAAVRLSGMDLDVLLKIPHRDDIRRRIDGLTRD